MKTTIMQTTQGRKSKTPNYGRPMVKVYITENYELEKIKKKTNYAIPRKLVTILMPTILSRKFPPSSKTNPVK